MLQARDFDAAVRYLRVAGLQPNFPRLAVAKLLLEAPDDGLDDLLARARDQDLPLSIADAAEALGELGLSGAAARIATGNGFSTGWPTPTCRWS